MRSVQAKAFIPPAALKIFEWKEVRPHPSPLPQEREKWFQRFIDLNTVGRLSTGAETAMDESRCRFSGLPLLPKRRRGLGRGALNSQPKKVLLGREIITPPRLSRGERNISSQAVFV
jgi:hypothetical protein